MTMSSEITLAIAPDLPERWPTLAEFIAYRAMCCSKSIKVQAADMDLAPSTLSRKLTPADGDTQRLNLHDLDAWLASTGEAKAVVEYLAAKYLDSDSARTARLMGRVQTQLDDMSRLLAQLKTQVGEA